MERSDIVVVRLTLLHTKHHIRVSGNKCPVFYLHETWVNQNRTLKYIWKDFTSNGRLKVPVGRGSQLIRHVGSTLTGSIPENKWVLDQNQQKTIMKK
jgi:hypothetical protein